MRSGSGLIVPLEIENPRMFIELTEAIVVSPFNVNPRSLTISSNRDTFVS